MTFEEEKYRQELLRAREKMAAEKAASPKLPVAQVKHVIAVYACKGGVGKSTVSVNLSVALARQGWNVGLLDADVHGPNIPLMMGVSDKPFVSEQNRITPLRRHGIEVMSLGLLKQAKLPFIWRGPMVHGAVQQLIRDTDWGKLDALIIDCPPGTGDAQLTILQTVPLAGVVFVSTPQQVSLADNIKGMTMVQKLGVQILGIIENMSGFECPHCHKETAIFSKGGAQAEAEQFKVPFLGSIPIDPQVVTGCDLGIPVVVSHPDSLVSKAIEVIAERVRFSIAQNPAPV